MSFSHKKIQPLGLSEESKKIVFGVFKKTLIGIVLVILGFGSMYMFGFLDSTIKQAQNISSNFISNTSQAIAEKIGKEMQKDEYGNINVLLVGYGGDNHAGGYLADSIIVVSYTPESNSATFISLPRDLVVNMSGYINKINSVMAYKYNKTKDLGQSAMALAKKSTEITGIEIPYYALIDFGGFSELIDSIGGIEVNVPQKVYDRSYPGPNWSYTIFSINSGLQQLDGATALKYARSRHSSSDFSRSQRQQLIIKAIMEKVFKDGTIGIGTIKNLYSSYTKMVTTNISLEEMIGLGQYTTTIPKIHSFGYTMECSNEAWKTMKPGCLLYPVNSQEFNGMSGLLPMGASIGKISYYDYTKYFGGIVSHNQEYLNEAVSINIYNATDKTYAKKFPYRNGISGKLAVKLRRNGFIIESVDNAPYSSTGTTAVIFSNKPYEETIRMLRMYVNIDTIEQHPAPVNSSGEELGSKINLYLGNTFLDQVGMKPFNYYK